MSTEGIRVAELRSLVVSDMTPYYDTHFNLLRWLQACPNDSIGTIAHRLRHHLLFRKSPWNIDAIHEQKHPSHPMHEYWQRGMVGHSGVIPNCIVYVEQAGFMDYHGMLGKFSLVEMVKALLWYAEEMLAEVMRIERETGEQASVVYVYDAAGVVYNKKLVDLMVGPLMALAECMCIHYVELIKHIVFVNVPPFANLLWAAVLPFLPARTKEKIRLLSASNWRNEIRLYMDPSVSPAFWNNEEHNDFQFPMERPNRVPADENSKGDTVRFRLTSNSSFGFAIVRAENAEENDVLALPQLFPDFPAIPGPLRVPIEETVIVPESGLYKVWFSNSRAWWSSLTVHYCIEVSGAEKPD